jgi:hypothetical protein
MPVATVIAAMTSDRGDSGVIHWFPFSISTSHTRSIGVSVTGSGTSGENARLGLPNAESPPAAA